MNSFGRDKRLTIAVDFSSVFKKNRRSADALFTVLAHKRQDSNSGRLGLAIAKRNINKSHDRNRVKRIVRESFRTHQDLLQGLDIVVMIRPNVNVDNRSELHNSLQKHWKQLSQI